MTREEALRAFISEARWFGGKGRDFEVAGVHELPLGIHLLDVRYADGDEDTYQLPLSAYDEPQDRLRHAFVGDWDGRFHYDAVHDRDEMARWLEAFDEAARGSPLGVGGAGQPALTFHRVPGHDLDLGTHSTLFSGEQSNSSVAFGEDSLMKVFRRITPGANPDIEIHRVLTEAGSEHVAQLYGWVEARIDGRDVQLAMLQQFLRTATEGWVFALTSVRNLFAEADLYPEEVGGDFAAESNRLGLAVAEVHETLRKHFPTQPMDVRAVAEGMRNRLRVAVRDVPEIGAHTAAAEAAFDRLAALDPNAAGEAQRIHGDLHLGQTLRTSLGWKLVDFEGEPAKPLRERLLPDSPWRDVGGMLRSFDYAAQTVLRDFEVEPDAEGQLAYRGLEWVRRNRDAFLDGYAEATVPLTDADHVLITAYELDKAVYECRYEARNRPEWLGIPLAALARAGEEA
jgi:maltokinase